MPLTLRDIDIPPSWLLLHIAAAWVQVLPFSFIKTVVMINYGLKQEVNFLFVWSHRCAKYTLQ